MLVEISPLPVKKVIEISLPYYTKDTDMGMYRINEDESVLRVHFCHGLLGGITLSKFNQTEAASGIAITKEEFEAHLQKAVEYMDHILSPISKQLL